jgi:hypothetical protein
MKKSNFKKSPEVPEIYGSLLAEGERTDPALKREFANAGSRYALLKFQTKKKYLDNITLCMKLMDIKGLHVSKSFASAITKYVDLSKTAKLTCTADLIIRKKSAFFGTSLASDTLIEILSALNLPPSFKTIRILGKTPQKKIVLAAAKLSGFTLMSSEEASITVLADRKISIKAGKKTILSSNQFDEMSAKLAVKLLTGRG